MRALTLSACLLLAACVSHSTHVANNGGSAQKEISMRFDPDRNDFDNLRLTQRGEIGKKSAAHSNARLRHSNIDDYHRAASSFPCMKRFD